MKTILTAITLLVLFTLNACATMDYSSSTDDIKFESEVDPKANFKGYKTYMWMGSAAILNDPEKLWNEPGFDTNAEIKYLIDTELRTKDMSKAVDNPDVLIGFALGINMSNIKYKENPDKTFKTLEEAPKGALVILMVDAQTGVIIWASKAKADVKGSRDEDVKARLKFAVNGMLSSLPEK